MLHVKAGMIGQSGDAVLSTPQKTGREGGAYPSLESAFAVGERSAGVCFYHPKTCSFHPYSLLQEMRLEREKLTLRFASVEMTIEGDGMHELFVQLAAQKVTRIIEQGPRYAAGADGAVYIIRVTATRRRKAVPSEKAAPEESEKLNEEIEDPD